MAYRLNKSIKGPAFAKATSRQGQVLIELLVAIGAAVIMIPAVFSGFITSREGRVQMNQRLVASAKAEEALETVRVIRDADWENIKTNGIYHPVISGSSWALVAGTETIDGFTRGVTISSVSRDVSGNITESGGTIDPSTKKVVANVSWQSFLPATVNITTYMTRLTSAEYTETLKSEFDQGNNAGTTVTNISGGEVQLGAGGHQNWCEPALTIAATDLPRQGDALAVTAVEGKAFAGTGANASGVSLATVDITNGNPPVATSPSNNWFGANPGDGQFKTNDVFGDANTGYLATDTNAKEIVLVNLTVNPYVETGYFDAPGNVDANSVFVVGNTGYMTQNNVLRNFDVTNCRTTAAVDSCPAIDADGVAISGTGTAVYVVGTYAFVSVSGSTHELEIFDLSNSTNLVRTGYADVNGQAARDVFVNATGTRAYIVTDASTTLPEFFIIDTTNKSCNDCPDLGVYNAGTVTNLKAVEVVAGAKAIVVGVGGEEYQVLDIADESLPSRCGGLQVDAGIKDSASVIESDNDAFTYFVTGDANAEFRIIEGGPGGGVSDNGVFTSRVFDAGKDTAFNRFNVTFTKPAQASIKFQMGVGDAIGGVCSAAGLTYVGPDGTSGTFYVDDGTIPFNDDGVAYENPGRCFAYKVFLNAPYATPVFYEITVSYSP